MERNSKGFIPLRMTRAMLRPEISIFHTCANLKILSGEMRAENTLTYYHLN